MAAGIETCPVKIKMERLKAKKAKKAKRVMKVRPA